MTYKGLFSGEEAFLIQTFFRRKSICCDFVTTILIIKKRCWDYRGTEILGPMTAESPHREVW